MNAKKPVPEPPHLTGTPAEQAQQLLRWADGQFGSGLVQACGLGMEGQVMIDLMCTAGLSIRVFTIDTGRLFPEAYDLIDRTEQRYGLAIRLYAPDHQAVEDLVSRQGINGFRAGRELRRECCRVRKLAPLTRALAGRSAWVCGLRRDQAETRTQVRAVEWDDLNGLYKINPLWDWSARMIREHVVAHDVPYNPLHDRGFSSIGCACCTRAIQPGEEERAGRWWWETDHQRECGLHHRPLPMGEGI